MRDTTIRARWEEEDRERFTILENARECAALTKPWYLPPIAQQENARLPQSFTSIGAYGLTNITGKLTNTIYEPGRAFFSLDVIPRLRYAMPPAAYQAAKDKLFVEELKAMALLESSHLIGNGWGMPRSFRSQKRLSIEQCVLTGDTLEFLTPEYGIRVFRRDQYVTCRDCTGAVRYHIIKESVNPYSLTEEQFAKAGLDRKELDEDDDNDPEVDSYTIVEQQPFSRTWTCRQEINGNVYNESEWNVNRFMATAYELAPGEDYGRGLIEQCIADLRSYNKLEGCKLDYAAIASKVNPVLDASSTIDPKALTKPSGEVILNAHVVNGIVQDVGYIKVDKLSDFQIVQAACEQLRKDLGQALLLESETVPQGEAGRHSFGWKVSLEQLQGMLGGAYAAITDEQQIPLVHALLDQMKVDRLIAPAVVDLVHVSTTTGYEAIIQKQRLAAIMNATNILAQIGQFNPKILERIDEGVFARTLARYQNIDEPGLIKSDEQMQQESRAAQAAQERQQIAAKAIDSIGNVAEAQAMPQMQQ